MRGVVSNVKLHIPITSLFHHFKLFSMAFIFGKTETEREKDLINQVRALQDSVEMQRQKVAEARNAVATKEDELRTALDKLQSLQEEFDKLKASVSESDNKNSANQKEIENIKTSLDENYAKLAEKDKIIAENVAKIEELTKIIAEKDARIAALTATQQPMIEEKKTQEQPQEKPAVDYTPKFDELKAELAKIKESYSDLVRKDELFNSMHKELDNLRNDVYSKLTRPYKVSIISLYDSISSTYNYYSNLKDEEGSYERLLKQLNNFILSIIDMLCDEYNLDSFEATVGEQFDRRAYKTMNVVETDDPAKHGTVARALQCGFKYTAYDPVKGTEREVIFRPAFVDTYKLKQQ